MSPRGEKKAGGRPPKAPEEQRKQLNTRVAPETLEFLEAEKDRTGVSIGKVVDHIVKTHRTEDRLPDAQGVD
jgi:transposase